METGESPERKYPCRCLCNLELVAIIKINQNSDTCIKKSLQTVIHGGNVKSENSMNRDHRGQNANPTTQELLRCSSGKEAEPCLWLWGDSIPTWGMSALGPQQWHFLGKARGYIPGLVLLQPHHHRPAGAFLQPRISLPVQRKESFGQMIHKCLNIWTYFLYSCEEEALFSLPTYFSVEEKEQMSLQEQKTWSCEVLVLEPSCVDVITANKAANVLLVLHGRTDWTWSNGAFLSFKTIVLGASRANTHL